jgi:hypothetical protein
MAAFTIREAGCVRMVMATALGKEKTNENWRQL